MVEPIDFDVIIAIKIKLVLINFFYKHVISYGIFFSNFLNFNQLFSRFHRFFSQFLEN
jgi:hypothetical protein